MKDDLRSPRATLFWSLHGLPQWEQKAFSIANLPFGAVSVILGAVLFIPFHIMILLRAPFMLLILAASAFWCVCLGILLPLSFITERLPVLRPLTFVLALPILIVAHNLNFIIPAPTPSDIEAKIEKWDLIEAFPLTWSLFRFSLSGGREGSPTNRGS